MSQSINFDYYYGEESEQFSFYRIPRQLVTGDYFRKLSTAAKLLYGLLLDRMGLSAKNGWYDEQGRVFIYYTLDEIQEDLNCGHEKAVKLLSELDISKGFGLVERKKQGQGKPTKIYVKKFATYNISPQTAVPQYIPRLPIFGSQNFGKSEVKSSEKPRPRFRKNGSADFGKSDANYTESNQTDSSQLNPSIHPLVFKPDWMDRYDCRAQIKERIGYDVLCRQYNHEDITEVVELLAETLCTTRPTVRIGGESIPASEVRQRLMSLEFTHVEYVFDCLQKNAKEIRNIRAYLLTALYNAPVTISNYYRAAVQHDWTGG